VPLATQPAYWQQPPPSYQLPGPSPGLRRFLIVMLVISSVLSGVVAGAGLLAIVGFVTDPTGTPADPGAILLIALFEVLFALTLAATIMVVRRSRGARVVSLVTGVAYSLTCLGLVLGIPIVIASIRAPMTKPAPPP
jgi:hypothetical protein